jgi:hypothetical protein
LAQRRQRERLFGETAAGAGLEAKFGHDSPSILHSQRFSLLRCVIIGVFLPHERLILPRFDLIQFCSYSASQCPYYQADYDDIEGENQRFCERPL